MAVGIPNSSAIGGMTGLGARVIGIVLQEKWQILNKLLFLRPKK